MISDGLFNYCGMYWMEQKPTSGKMREREREREREFVPPRPGPHAVGEMVTQAGGGEALEGTGGSKQLLQRQETGSQTCFLGRRTGQRTEAQAAGSRGREIPGSSFGVSEW